MKKIFFSLILSMFLAFGLNQYSYSQPQPPAGHGSEVDEIPGGSAPIGDGLFILAALAFGYAGYKVYRNWEKITE
jgi:hypothetical protein